MDSSSEAEGDEGRVYVRIGVGVDVVAVGSEEFGSGTVWAMNGPMAKAMC